MERAIASIGGVIQPAINSADAPVPFSIADLADHVEMIGLHEQTSQYLDFLVARIRELISDEMLNSIIGDSNSVSLDEWLQLYVDGGDSDKPKLTIIDLSLVPSNVVQLVASVIARILFESLQRYMKLHLASLPTVLFVEEAHSFIRRYRDEVNDNNSARVCCETFETIAREGRKFGLGLVLSSQRPSELSPIVLSQCNSFLLHRISNDRDQELISRLVPDNLRGLLRELPSLPSQNAILVGWASELPVLLRVRDLPLEHRPRSDDPNFWEVWTRQEDRVSGWHAVANDWQSISDLPRLPPDSNVDAPSEQNGSESRDVDRRLE